MVLAVFLRAESDEDRQDLPLSGEGHWGRATCLQEAHFTRPRAGDPTPGTSPHDRWTRERWQPRCFETYPQKPHWHLGNILVIKNEALHPALTQGRESGPEIVAEKFRTF